MCEHCNDTGSLSKDLDGYLDCTRCEVATQRTVLEAWVGQQPANLTLESIYWLIHQRAIAPAATEAQ